MYVHCRSIFLSLTLLAAYGLPASLEAQVTIPLAEKKFSNLKDGKGYLIEDFGYFKSQVVENISSVGSSAVDGLDETLRKRADSLFEVLKKDRSVSMPREDLSLVKHFPAVDEEPRVIANLVFTLARLGGSRSLEYAVRRGDTLEIEYTILRGKGFDEIEVLEGKELRFNAARNMKKAEVNNQLVILADGMITVNLYNKGPVPSKGKLVITVRPALARLALRYLCDTLANQVKMKVLRVDTLSEIFFSRAVALASGRDITRTPFVRVDVPVTPGRRYLAMGYWLGTGEKSLKAWQTLATAEASPLLPYLTGELKRRDRVRLPVDTYKEVRFDIRFDGVSLRSQAQNGMQGTVARDPEGPDVHPNYGFVALTRGLSMPSSIGLELENLSKVYGCQTQVDVVGLYTESHEEELEVEEKTCREYIKLSFL
ncbi:MAG: hypothetical protein FJX89_06680 [Bacteroidetes bacterium]|nr:hypothetical protein [Bacteroidota bacterium]